MGPWAYCWATVMELSDVPVAQRVNGIVLFSFGFTLLAYGGQSSGSKGRDGGTPSGDYEPTVTGAFTSGSTTLTNSTKLTLVVR